MKTLTIDVPAMYGDHHVNEVKRLLEALPGVDEVYASSAFHTVEVSYEEGKISEDEITETLDKAGYLGELPVEVEVPASKLAANGDKAFFRHSAAYQQTREAMGFAQNVTHQGRPLWPCPGMGTLKYKADGS